MGYGARMLSHAMTWLADVRRRFGRHPLLVDGLLAGATLVVSLALGSQDPPAGLRHMGLLGYVLTCLISALLVARQRAPVTVLVLYCVLWIGYIVAGYWPVVNSPGLLLALYTVAARRRVRAAVAAAVLAAAVWVYGGRESILVAAVQGVVWTSVIVWFGHGARQLAGRNQQLTQLAGQLEYEREQGARRAVVDERVRIARELHDVVAHHMSVISVQAGLARYVLDSDPEIARAALGTVLETSGEALEEMRRLLSVLRFSSEGVGDEDESFAPAPGLDQLGDLVERVCAAGLSVEVVVTGAPRPLPPGADVCAYRVIQESLTNVLKHAGSASATLTLHHASDRLTARVRDDGRRVPEAGSVSRGHGLLGMRERAELYGGTLTAGPHPLGGFEVALTLPVPAIMDDVRLGGADDGQPAERNSA
jgi:signal transduction histidine kinase